MAVDGDDDFFGGDSKLPGGRIEDAHVRLMRNQPVHVRGLHFAQRQRFPRDFIQHAHRQLEYRLPVHAQKRISRHLAAADMARRRQDAGVRTIGVQHARAHTGRCGCRQYNRAGAVAEQYAGAAIFPIEYARKHFGTYDERALVHAAADEFIRDVERINEAGTHRLHVECRTALAAQPRL